MKGRTRVVVVVAMSMLATACIGVTRDATGVTDTSASLNGTGWCEGTACDTYFEYWQTDSPGEVLTTPVRHWTNLPPSTGVDALPESVTNLAPDTNYSFRFCGKEAADTDFHCAGTLQFWTQPDSSGLPAGSVCRPELPDATAALQAWLDAVPDGQTATLEPGCYRLDGTLLIESRTDLVLDGNGATFRSYPDSGAPRGQAPHVDVRDSTNITIQNLTIDGGHAPGYVPETANQSAFWLDWWCDPRDGPSCVQGRNDGVTLVDVTANRVGGDYVYVRGSDNVEVVGATFGMDDDPATLDGNGRQGIAVTSGTNIHVHDSEISNAARAVLDIEPNTATETVTNVTFENNLTRQSTPGTGLSYFANGGANSRIEHIYLLSNTLQGRAFRVFVTRPNAILDDLDEPADYLRFDYRILGNTSDYPTSVWNDHAFHIGGVRQVLVWANDVVIGSPQPQFGTRPTGLVDFNRAYTTSVWANTVRSDRGGADWLATYSVGEIGYYLNEDWLDCTRSPCVQRRAGDDLDAGTYQSLPAEERPDVTPVDLTTRDMCEGTNTMVGATPPPELPTPGTYPCVWG